MKNIQTSQKGFTLVEIAIVLVIIGLLLGGVLKGQELIRGAKIKAAADEVKAYQAAYFGYVDRFDLKPGDDPGMTRWASGLSGNGNGNIDGGTCNNDADESCMAIRAMRYAGFLKGDPTETVPKPRLKLGGIGHVYTGTHYGQQGVWLRHVGNVPEDILAELDRKIDDGKCNSGSMVSVSTSNTYCDQATGEYKADYYYVVKID